MYTGGTPPASGPRILVVRLGALGDIVHALPAVASLKHSFPGSHLTWAVEERWAPLLEGNPFVDRVLALRRDSPAAVWEGCRRLRSARYDFAVDFQGLVKSALAATVARPGRIFGYHPAQARERWAALFYSHKILSSSAHMVDRHLDLARAAGAPAVVRAFPLPPGRPEAPLPDGPFVLACPLAGWRSKQWPLEYYVETAALLRPFGVTLVLDGPPAALDSLAGLEGVFRHSSTLSGLLYALRRAAAVIGVDSGPLHLAAALGKPGVAIFGPTDPARNGPYGGTLTVLRSASAATTYKRHTEIDPGMRAITPEMVVEALSAR